MQVLVVSHSWGDNVFRNFLVWVGAQDPQWCEDHIATYANVAGPTLGVAKAITSFLSGAQALYFPESWNSLVKSTATVNGILQNMMGSGLFHIRVIEA